MAGSNMSPVAPGARAQPPPPLSLGAGGDGATLKVAVTVAFLVSEQRSVPAQSPLHPAKTDPGSGAAVRFTVLPRGELAIACCSAVNSGRIGRNRTDAGTDHADGDG